MARIIYVPRWLKEILDGEKIPVEEIVNRPLVELLPNRQDLLIYMKSQRDFIKYLTVQETPISVEQRLALNEKAMTLLYQEQWPSGVDEINYHLALNDKIPDYELLHLDSDAASINDLSFDVVSHESMPIVFVIGKLSPGTEYELPVWKKTLFLMREILKSSYAQQRLHIGGLDRSGFVNQNETLLSFYVGNVAFL